MAWRPGADSRKARSSALSWKRFSERELAQRVFFRMVKSDSQSGSPSE